MKHISNRSSTSRILAASAACFLLLFAAADTAAAAALTVNSLADTAPDGCTTVSGGCTLREAIESANASQNSDTISFAPGLSGVIQLTRGQLTISSSVAVTGPGARALSVVGDDNDRVFLIATPPLGGDIAVSLGGFTVTGGAATAVGNLAGDGGGVLNGALLGIIGGTSTLNLSDVAVVNNKAATLGGGVATRLGAITNITRSLIAGNVSNAIVPITGDAGGGGVSNVAATTSISNSTITNNNSFAAGGGILNVAGVVNLTNDTISDNISTLGGGGVVSTIGVLTPVLGVTRLRNTIIARNAALLDSDLIASDVLGVLGSFDSLGNNLIGSNTNAEASFAAGAVVGGVVQPNVEADLVGDAAVGNQILDPQLGALQNNGGATDTRAVSASSPALNNGNNCVFTETCAENPAGDNPQTALTTDQRGAGFSRLNDSAVEIGAFERRSAATAAAVSIAGKVTDAGGRAISKATVTVITAAGSAFTKTTNSLGYYKFDDLGAGEVCVVSVKHKQHVFAAQAFYLSETREDLNFAPEPARAIE